MHGDRAALDAACAHQLGSPRDCGVVALVVTRPAPGEREVLVEGMLDPERGLVGDCWRERDSRRTPDGAADPLRQITLVNARVIDLLAGTRDGVLKVWPTRPEYLADDICSHLVRNMSRAEWQRYVGEDIPYMSACKVQDTGGEPKNE